MKLQDRNLLNSLVELSTSRKDNSVIRVHYDKRRYYEELRQLFETVEQEILRITGKQVNTSKVIHLR